MHDNDAQIEYRCNMYHLTDKVIARKIIKGITAEINKYNPWVKEFKSFYEEHKHKSSKNISLIIEKNPKIPRGGHPKQYSTVENNQVGVLLKRKMNTPNWFYDCEEEV